jgi:hypothetical protein
MHGQYRKVGPYKILKFKPQGLSCVQVARRLDVSVTAVSLDARDFGLVLSRVTGATDSA